MVLAALLALHTLRSLAALDPPDPAVTIAPSEVAFVAARHAETVIRGRPWVPHRRVATIAGGTRLAVRGTVESRDDKGCRGRPWYAVYPFGFVCSEHVRESESPPELGAALPPLAGKRLPHSYAIVRQDGVPQYDSEEEARIGLPSRTLTKNMSLVVKRTLRIDGADYLETQHGAYVPRDGVGWMGQGADWRGVVLEGFAVGPAFAWVSSARAVARVAPDPKAEVAVPLQLRQRVPLLEPSSVVDPEFWRIAEGQWVAADQLNEVVIVAPPKPGWDQWIDVDVGEQVLVAYRGRAPVFATLVASGRSSPTPLGNYPIWAKVATMDMANQDYEDKPYMVQGVPWVLLFQGHNAIHGAYWHDRFGHRRSHGCVNAAPIDAHWLFEWVAPTLPRGWTGYLPADLSFAPVVHVRDSSRPSGLQFTQQRPIGPPDAEEERRKSELAAERRAEEAREELLLWPSRDDEFDSPIGERNFGVE